MLIISIVGVQCRKYSAISCFWTSWKGSKTLQYFEMKEAFFRLSPGQTRILGVDVYENWQARVCMRVFSTLMSHAWSCQTRRRVAVRVDESWLDVGARPWRKLYQFSSKLMKVTSYLHLTGPLSPIWTWEHTHLAWIRGNSNRSWTDDWLKAS